MTHPVVTKTSLNVVLVSATLVHSTRSIPAGEIELVFADAADANKKFKVTLLPQRISSV
jgi:hypothetical protein